MARAPRVVAELGRPETPDEMAARKAESSRIYRSSQTFRNLIAALLVTVGLVLVIILIVPRGEAQPSTIDAPALAAEASAAYGREVIVADVPDDWRVNGASVDATAGGVTSWVTIYAPESEGGFVRVAQGFDADEAWARSVLRGAAPIETITIEGREWMTYRFTEGESANVTYALSTQAGPDHVIVYGSVAPDTAQWVAAGIEGQLRGLETGS